MHNEAMPAARRNHSGSTEGVQRLELLSSRFSAAEIDRLSQLQLRHRERVAGLDPPLEECRLRFARWLVERGKLGEDDGIGPEAPPRGIPSGHLDGGPVLEGIRDRQCQDWRLALRGAFARIRQGIARAAGLGRELGGLGYLPGAAGPWSSYGSSRSFAEDQWIWMRFRNGC